MSTIFKEINNLPFDDNKKADLLDFFTNRDTTRVETVLLATEKDEVKVNYLRKHAKSLRDNLDEHQEDKDETSIIYICKCYRDLAKIAFDKKTKKRLRISSNPESYQKNSNAWYIVNAKIPVKVNARTILLCSSRKDLYRDFDKFGLLTIQFMPVWRRREIDECRDKIFYNIEKENVEELFLKWRGIPRFVLEQANDKGYQDMFEKAINKYSIEIFKYISESTDIDKMSHKLIHIYTNLPFTDEVKDENEMDLDTILTIPNDVMLDQHSEGPYTKSIVRFTSNFVKQEVTKILEEDIKNKLRTETNLSLKAGISNSLLGMLFEQIAHRMLCDGGIFKTRSLELNGLEKVLVIN
ncbi:5691_t:CDS:2, partial [Funneliformis caledonium]